MEAIAQRWADQCTFGHDIARNKIDGTSVSGKIKILYRSIFSFQGWAKCLRKRRLQAGGIGPGRIKTCCTALV